MSVQLRIPPKYVHGAGVLSQIGEFIKKYGQRVLVVGGHQALQAVENKLGSLQQAGVEVVGIEWFGGECTWDNIQEISDLIEKKDAQLLLVVGGGKALDTGKAAAFKSQVPCVTVPTIAATCAAFTPLSIIHDDQGIYVENSALSACPVGVFVDTTIIINAPAKWLFAGMGDTLAKFYELRATTGNISATSWTIGGITNGEICYQIIKQFGSDAKKAHETGSINESLEYVIDAIIFYAGMSSILGGEKCRGAAAHSVYFGFTNIPAAHAIGHGLLVGFGNLVLLALEERSTQEILPEIKLALECGLPIKLDQIAQLTNKDLQTVAKVAAAAADMKNMPRQVTPEMVVTAMKIIDRLSKENF